MEATNAWIGVEDSWDRGGCHRLCVAYQATGTVQARLEIVACFYYFSCSFKKCMYLWMRCYRLFLKCNNIYIYIHICIYVFIFGVASVASQVILSRQATSYAFSRLLAFHRIKRLLTTAGTYLWYISIFKTMHSIRLGWTFPRQPSRT